MTLASRLFVVALSVALLTATASAGTITYQANADPTGATYDGYTTEAGIQPFNWLGATPNDDYATIDGTIPVWVSTDSASGDYDDLYHIAPTAADKALAAANGWTLTANLKLSGDVTGFTYIARYWDGDANEVWSMWFKNEAGGTSPPVIEINNQYVVGYVFDAPDTGYHSYQLVYDPANPGGVDFLIDGVKKNSSLLAPLSYGGAYDSVAFGDNTSTGDYSGMAYFREVTWQAIPEPSTLALLGTAVLGLLAYAWRRRK